MINKKYIWIVLALAVIYYLFIRTDKNVYVDPNTKYEYKVRTTDDMVPPVIDSKNKTSSSVELIPPVVYIKLDDNSLPKSETPVNIDINTLPMYQPYIPIPYGQTQSIEFVIDPGAYEYQKKMFSRGYTVSNYIAPPGYSGKANVGPFTWVGVGEPPNGVRLTRGIPNYM
jgi:hypothetical protein